MTEFKDTYQSLAKEADAVPTEAGKHTKASTSRLEGDAKLLKKQGNVRSKDLK